MIAVHLYGKLRRFSGDPDPRRKAVIRVEVANGETIVDVVHRIGIPLEDLGRNIFLNGEVSLLERGVKEGDRLGLFPDDMQLIYRWFFPRKGGDAP